MRAALTALAELGTLEAISSLYETAPVGGPPQQPRYRNAVVRLLPFARLAEPPALMAALHRIEDRFGRERRLRDEPRTLDLDLLALGASIRASAPVLPHPRMRMRGFVLAPLAEIDPRWRDPRDGVTAAAAWREVRLSGQTGDVRRAREEWPSGPR